MWEKESAREKKHRFSRGFHPPRMDEKSTFSLSFFYLRQFSMNAQRNENLFLNFSIISETIIIIFAYSYLYVGGEDLRKWWNILKIWYHILSYDRISWIERVWRNSVSLIFRSSNFFFFILLKFNFNITNFNNLCNFKFLILEKFYYYSHEVWNILKFLCPNF